VIEVEEGLNIVKEALESGEEHHEYNAYSSSQWEKVHNKHDICENLLLHNNKRIHDVENQIRAVKG